MRRAAIYARYSTDRQDERSIDDQIALCRGTAARDGLSVSATYSDAAASSASLHGRPGAQALVAAARRGEFDVVLVECVDRLSRSQADLPWIFERLTFAGIALIAVDEGPIDELKIGVRSITGPIALKDIRNKVRRGMAGRVAEGKNGGGRAYGYRAVPGRPGELVIEESEAAIVRRIFAEYVAQKRPRIICAGLNRDGVPPPRGKMWRASTINGNATRGHGILLNEIYTGLIVWNRVRMVKNPDTGKRVSRSNAGSEVQRIAAPHLRIVDDDTWRKAQAIKQSRAHGHFSTARKPKRILSGLIKCGCCGSSMAIADRDKTGKHRMRCTQAVEAGTCRNGRRPCVEDIEARVLAGLAAKLKAPEYLARYVEEYNRERRRLAGAAAGERARLERRAGEVKRELERAIDMVVKGLVDPESMRGRLAELQAEQRRITAALEAAADADKIVALHPSAIDNYRRDVADLAAAFARGTALNETEAAERLRTLVERVIVTPQDRGYAIEIEGRLALLTSNPEIFPNGLKAVAGDRSGLSPGVFRFAA